MWFDKKRAYVLVCVAVASLSLLSCMGRVASKNTTQVPEVNMVSCLPSFAGSESIALMPIFRVTNPNSFLIESVIDYNLETSGNFLGKSEIRDLHIPGQKTIEIKDTIVIPFNSWMAAEIFSGKSKEEAVRLVAPLWKSLKGQRPAALPEGVWNQLPEKQLKMRASGTVQVVNEPYRNAYHFESESED
jgi:hypothetical protein